jgi:hypothetical protein
MHQIGSWTEEEHNVNRKRIAASVDVVINKILGK